jgi:hypothetical protein
MYPAVALGVWQQNVHREFTSLDLQSQRFASLGLSPCADRATVLPGKQASVSIHQESPCVRESPAPSTSHRGLTSSQSLVNRHLFVNVIASSNTRAISTQRWPSNISKEVCIERGYYVN